MCLGGVAELAGTLSKASFGMFLSEFCVKDQIAIPVDTQDILPTYASRCKNLNSFLAFVSICAKSGSHRSVDPALAQAHDDGTLTSRDI